jgi:hypothetical protein
MNRRNLVEVTELLERISSLIEEYVRTKTLERREVLEAELTAAKEQLQKFAASFQN